MSTLTSLLLNKGLQPEQPVAAQPEAPKTNWMQDLIAQRYQPKSERIKRNPVGFEFKRDPFDPSSFFKALQLQTNVSRAATQVSQQEAFNRQARESAASSGGIGPALGGVAANFVYGSSKQFGLSGVTKNTSNAANYFGGKYGIKNIGGYRSKGSVPGSDHPKGRALDFMTNNKAKGTSLANDVIKNWKKWNVKYVIWYRYIWSPGKGWRKYSGPSPHTDHVHVSFNK